MLELYKKCKGYKEKTDFAMQIKLNPDGSTFRAEGVNATASKEVESNRSGWASLCEVCKHEGLKWDSKDETVMDIVSGIVDGVPNKAP